ncbi:E3 ubiquitin-protein ligase RNF25 isoform X2 [Panicum miliaceum]|uniref:E3 ubiquitin-protein ligase RNF25 isoform X2 n=1 Tax=Panicum miliaceum TaxID=4540 RepID=A0A3L6PJS2_PANMI|nr:E3 ubiquitin-protein ligase RNF25 isoform X2 [Panicum miliaceum]
MAAQTEAEEEVRLELEAVAAVYGDDVRVLRDLPPHLVVHVRPRTADDSSQQFVELLLGVKASSQYPKEPPHICAVESKGLDENRQSYLISSIQNKAKELSNYPVLVTLCEEAGEILLNMNHQAGDCPLCLYSLVGEDKDGSAFYEVDVMLPLLPQLILWYCSNCIMRWWEWVQHGDANPKEHNTGVCRKVFDEKDIEHVHDLLGESTSQLASLTLDLGEDEKELLHSEAEQIRRKRIESLFNLQQERNGLIEPKKDLAIQPGMYVTLPPSTPDTATGENVDPSEDTTTSTSETELRSQANSTGILDIEGEIEPTLQEGSLTASLVGNSGRGKKQTLHTNNIEAMRRI